MRPVTTPDSNTTLTLPGPGRKGDLPAERCQFVNPDPPYEQADGFETVWQPDPGETRALANGAPVLLRLWGIRHPPVNLAVGEPAADAEPQLPSGVVGRAVGHLYGLLEPDIGSEQFLTLWTHALSLAHQDRQKTARTAGSNGGPGHPDAEA